VAVEKVFHVSSDIAHTVNDSRWKLAGGRFHCNFSIVQNTEISSAQGAVLFIELDKVNFQVSWQLGSLSLDFLSRLLVFGQNHRRFKEIFVDALNLGR
jgi:hypothetical protein